MLARLGLMPFPVGFLICFGSTFPRHVGLFTYEIDNRLIELMRATCFPVELYTLLPVPRIFTFILSTE